MGGGVGVKYKKNIRGRENLIKKINARRVALKNIHVLV